MTFVLALSPILWLIVSLGFLKMQSFKACPLALIISFLVALLYYHMSGVDAGTAALEGVALACWPILLVIIAAIFTYNLTLYTKSMDIVKHMLTTVSKDQRVLALLIGWGFGAFMEGMAGFGTAIAIPASMLVAMGFNPIKAILLCLIANSVPTTYGSIGIPASTLANLTGLDPVQLSTYISLQLLPLNIICPFLMVIVVGGSIKALRGVFLLTLLCGLGLALPELLISAIAGPELAVMISSVVIMGIIVLYSKYRPSQDETYHMDIHPAHVPLHGGFLACLPFILIFVFLRPCNQRPIKRRQDFRRHLYRPRRFPLYLRLVSYAGRTHFPGCLYQRLHSKGFIQRNVLCAASNNPRPAQYDHHHYRRYRHG